MGFITLSTACELSGVTKHQIYCAIKSYPEKFIDYYILLKKGSRQGYRFKYEIIDVLKKHFKKEVSQEDAENYKKLYYSTLECVEKKKNIESSNLCKIFDHIEIFDALLYKRIKKTILTNCPQFKENGIVNKKTQRHVRTMIQAQTFHLVTSDEMSCILSSLQIIKKEECFD